MDNMVMLGGAIAIGGAMLLLVAWGMGDKDDGEEDGEENNEE